MIKLAVAVALAVIALLTSGAASTPDDMSTGDSYTTPARAWVEPAVVAPGGRATITFTPGYFEPFEHVEVSVEGLHADNARVMLENSMGSGVHLSSRADGAMTAVFIAPRNGKGPYVLHFTATRDFVAVVTVVPRNAQTWCCSSADGSAGRAPRPQDQHFRAPSLGDDESQPGARHSATPIPEDEGAPAPSGTPSSAGGVDVPGDAPGPQAWPMFTGVPWFFLLLAAIALVVSTVTVTLVLAARRRG